MKDENTIKLIEKSEEIVQNLEWDRKYDYKLKAWGIKWEDLLFMYIRVLVI